MLDQELDVDDNASTERRGKSMGQLPRGKCSVCGQDVALRKNGSPREHRGMGDLEVCPGSGQLPTELPAKTATEVSAVANLEDVLPPDVMHHVSYDTWVTEGVPLEALYDHCDADHPELKVDRGEELRSVVRQHAGIHTPKPGSEAPPVPSMFDEDFQTLFDAQSIEQQVQQARQLMAVYKLEWAMAHAGLAVTESNGSPRSQRKILEAIRETRKIIEVLKALKQRIEDGEGVVEPETIADVTGASKLEIARTVPAVSELSKLREDIARMTRGPVDVGSLLG